jgi:hypothetical protein
VTLPVLHPEMLVRKSFAAPAARRAARNASPQNVTAIVNWRISMSDFDDLYGGRFLSAAEVKKPVTAIIERIEEESFPRPGEATRPKKVLYVHGGKKGIVLNKTDANTLALAFGKTFPAWVGQRVLIKAEPTTFAGKTTMGLRLYPANGQAVEPPKPPPPEEPDDDISW